MGVITGGNIIGGGPPQRFSQAGVPVGGTDEVQTLTIGGTPSAAAGSGFRLAFMGWTTDLILWSATNNTLRDRVDAALEALPNIGTGGVATAVGTMTAGVGTLTITFSGTRLKKLAVPTITVAENALAGTSPTVAVVETTPGVDASYRDAPTGAHLTDETNGVEYVNTGTAGAPTWSAVSVGSISQELLDFVAAIPATHIAATGAMSDHVAATAIAATYADLAAARTSVNTLRTEVETALALHDTHIETLSDKIDAILTMLETVKITATS